MMSPVIAIPVILLMSSIVSADAYVVISKIPNELSKQNLQLDAKVISNGDFNNTQIEAIVNDFERFVKDSNLDDDIKSDLILKWNQPTPSHSNAKNAVANEDTLSDARIKALPTDYEMFGEGSKIGEDIARKDLIRDDDRPKWNQLTNSQANAINTAVNEEVSDAQIEAITKDLDTFGEHGAKFDTHIAKNLNVGDDKEIEMPNWIKRVKRDLKYVWDNCPGKTSLQFVDDVFKCLPDNDQAGLGDRVFGPLENGSCSAGQTKVQLGGATFCIEERRRRKNGRSELKQ